MRHILRHYPKLIPISALAIAAWVKALTGGELDLDADSITALVTTVLTWLTFQVRQQPLPEKPK